jgi:hypothetical protein
MEWLNQSLCFEGQNKEELHALSVLFYSLGGEIEPVSGTEEGTEQGTEEGTDAPEVSTNLSVA